MDKTKIIGLIIVLLMGFSVGGTALFFSPLTNPIKNTQEEGISIPPDFVFNQTFTLYEKQAIISNGIALIEYLHPRECGQECVNKIADLRTFAILMDGSVFVSIYPSDQEKLQIIGGDGTISPLENTSQEYLEDVLCEKAVLKPKFCLLREFNP